ncbi:MAG: polysaccharide biosynthesis/export family protein [Terrimicrobiaceae bacterium]
MRILRHLRFLMLGVLSASILPLTAADAPLPVAAEVGPGYGEMPYLLGAGDVLSIQFYGRPELTRPQVTVAPDGTISYLSATGVEVRGKTIDQARGVIEATLTKYYRTPKIIVTPIQLLSKNYTIMGMVKASGVFPLEQPITLIEALARSGGTVSGLFDRRYVDLADLERSFIMRDGKRLPVNFRKLMLEGDMSQNVALAPGDYIQVASALSNDYYVLGSVRKPGREGFTEGASVIAAISKRLGFLDEAYRERVIVVRGSMTKPEVLVVNADAILKGSAKDFPLMPKDIVYVSNRPWRKVEEVLDSAVTVFLQSAVATWTGANAPILFKNALLPYTPYNLTPPGQTTAPAASSSSSGSSSSTSSSSSSSSGSSSSSSSPTP